MGPYDSLDPELIEAQIRLAQGAGIDGFITSWWGPGEREDKGFAMLLEYVLETYGGSEAFLRLWGKPVVFVYNAEAHGRDPGFWGGWRLSRSRCSRTRC